MNMQTLWNVGTGLLALTVLSVVFYGVQPTKVTRHRGGAYTSQGRSGSGEQDY